MRCRSTARRVLLVPIVAAISLLTCRGENPATSARAPATLRLVHGAHQRAPAGTPLPDSLVVRVADAEDSPVEGVAVHWTAAEGGRVSPAETVTDADGRAAAAWILGSAAGEQRATAAVEGLDSVSFVATAGTVAEPLDTLLSVIVEPPSSALSGEVFRADGQPVIAALNQTGKPIRGITITAAIASGGGRLEGDTAAVTSSDGLARFANLGVRGDAGERILRFSVDSTSVHSNPIQITALGREAKAGEWAAPFGWPIVPVHAHLLPTGVVLAWGRDGQPHLWDPATGDIRPAAVDTMLFCAGHAFLPDGRLLTSGGHIDDLKGSAVTYTFDPVSLAWTREADMARGRWYPTVTVLPDGRAVTVAGTDEGGGVVEVPEVWDGSRWTRLPDAALRLQYYPRNFVAPNGLVFSAGIERVSRYLDVGGGGSWRRVATHRYPEIREYGSAAMYAPGKILVVGGGGKAETAPTNTAEVIDLNDASPEWRYTGSMARGRRQLNATILPDGQVLVTGGTDATGFNNPAGAVHAAELWNPETEEWTTLASNAVDRLYHSVALLLPDGRVLSAGGGEFRDAVDHPDGEIFSPPYLFKGARPTIAGVPTAVSYGETFHVETPDAGSVTRVTLVRLGSVTHAFDQNQRFNELEFEAAAGGLDITAPGRPSLAPPGHYLLFILNRNGVPSVGEIIQLR